MCVARLQQCLSHDGQKRIQTDAAEPDIRSYCSSSNRSFSQTHYDLSQREKKCANYKINESQIPLSCFSFSVLSLCMMAHSLSRYHGLLGRLNTTKPSLMLLVTPKLFQVEVRISAVKGALCSILLSV